MGIYNFKEKQKHFNELRNNNAVLVDLALLEKKQASHPQLARFQKMPFRFADEILYALLDFCTRDQIIKNRRDDEKKAADAEDAAKKAAEEDEAKAAEEAAKKEAEEAEAKAKEEADKKAAEDAEPAADTVPAEDLQALQEEHDALLEEHEEVLAEKEELEETNQQLEADLEKEKKKKLPKKTKA